MKVLLTIALISSLFLVIGCEDASSNQKFITNHNLKILDTVIKKVCYRWKKDSLKKNSQLHLITYPDEGFDRLLHTDIMNNVKYHPELKEIFTEDNIAFFQKQLKSQPDDFFTNLLPRNECFIMKNEIQQEEQIPPPLHKPQDYYISKVIFTTDFQYALFVAGKDAFGLDIYRFEDGEFIPYKSVFLYME